MCRGCGESAGYKLIFAVDYKISPETVALCEPCAVKLGALAELLRLRVDGRRGRRVG